MPSSVNSFYWPRAAPQNQAHSNYLVIRPKNHMAPFISLPLSRLVVVTVRIVWSTIRIGANRIIGGQNISTVEHRMVSCRFINTASRTFGAFLIRTNAHWRTFEIKCIVLGRDLVTYTTGAITSRSVPRLCGPKGESVKWARSMECAQSVMPGTTLVGAIVAGP